MKPLVSIIVPVYNLENYILSNLESLINQSYKNIEVIVVNDGSTDNSLKIIEEFFKDRDIKNQVISIENSGVSRARNIGLASAKGDYIILLDGDDRFKPHAIETFINTIEETGAEVCFGGYEEYSKFGEACTHRYCDNKTYIEEVVEGYKALQLKLSKKIWICTGTAAYSRELLLRENIGYTANKAYGEDIEFINKSLYHAKKVSSVKEDLLEILVRPGSAMSSKFSLKYMDALDTNRSVMEHIKSNHSFVPEEDFKNIKLLIDYDYINILLGVAKKIYEEYGWLSVFQANKKVKELKLIEKLSNAEVDLILSKIKNSKTFEIKVFRMSRFLYFYACKILFLLKKGN